MKKLPDHTTRYFASQDYYLVAHRGSRGPWKHRTVQGVDLKVEYDFENHTMVCTYTVDFETVKKVYPVAKSWAY